MLIRSRSVLAPVELLQQADPPGGGGGAPSGETGGNPVTFTKEQNEAIGRMISEERKKAADAAKTELQQQIDAARQKDEDERTAADLKAKGEYEALEADLKSKLQAAQDDAKQARAELKRYQEAIDAALKPVSEKVPEKVMKLYPGAEDDPLAKWEFIHRDATQDLIKDLAGEEQKPNNGNGRGPGGDRTGGTGPTVEQELALARQRRTSF